MNGIGRVNGALATVGVALLALLVVPALAAPVQAAPVTPSASASQQWAYGAQTWENVTVNLTNATLVEHAFFGWQVVITATNTSLTTQAWEAQRTMAGHLYADYCQPNCTAPTSHGNLSLAGWEVDAGFANLTLSSTVYENGSAVPAIGILNASFENSANLSESMRFTFGSGVLTGTSSAALYVAGAAHGSVVLSPALGLVPLNLTSGSVWNSSSTYSAAGGWSASYTWDRVPFVGTPSHASASATGMLNSSGSVEVHGADLGTVTLSNGETVPVVVTTWEGPFDAVDGFVLIPHDFDLFGGSAHAWDHDGLGNENVATSALDVRVDDTHHLRLVAAATAYGSTTAALPVSSPMPMTGGSAPMATSSSPGVLQGQPEPVPQAQANAACLTSGCGGASSGHGLLSAFLVLGIVGAVALAVVGLALLLRHRRGGAAVNVPAHVMAPRPIPPAPTDPAGRPPAL